MTISPYVTALTVFAVELSSVLFELLLASSVLFESSADGLHPRNVKTIPSFPGALSSLYRDVTPVEYVTDCLIIARNELFYMSNAHDIAYRYFSHRPYIYTSTSCIGRKTGEEQDVRDFYEMTFLLYW